MLIYITLYFLTVIANFSLIIIYWKTETPYCEYVDFDELLLVLLISIFSLATLIPLLWFLICQKLNIIDKLNIFYDNLIEKYINRGKNENTKKI